MNLCLQKVIKHPEILFYAGEIGITLFLLCISFILLKRKIIHGVVGFILFPLIFFFSWIVLSVAFFFAFVIITEPWGQLHASMYFPLHAAIKNTCILDPHMVHCPRTVSEIVQIQPELLQPLLQSRRVLYQYTDEKNYTLMIVEPRGDVIIFDPRLLQYPQYGYGGDYIETELDSCRSSLKVVNPPPFSGLWDRVGDALSY